MPRVQLEYLEQPPQPPIGPEKFVYVTADEVVVRRIAANEPDHTFECLITLALGGGGQELETVFACNHKNDQVTPTQVQGLGRLLYAGYPKGTLGLRVDAIESDADQAEFLQGIAELFSKAQQGAGQLPLYGAPVSAGLGLLASVTKLIGATIDNDHEMSYIGALSNALPGRELRPGRYRVFKGRAGQSGQADIAVDFTIREAASAILAKDTEVLVVLKELRLELPAGNSLDSDDTLLIESGFGVPKQLNKLHFEEKFRNNRQDYPERLTFDHAVLYRGPYGEGIPFTLSLQALHHLASKQIAEVVAKATTLVSALRPEFKRQAESASGPIQELGNALAKLRESGAFAELTKGILVQGVRADNPHGRYPADLSGGGWTDYEIQLPTGKDDNGKPCFATFKIGARKA